MYTTHQINRIPVTVCDTAAEAGERAAARAGEIIGQAVAVGTARVIFASAPSQATMLRALVGSEVPWQRVEALHMDEYVGLPASDPRSFSQWLADRLPVEQMAAFHRIDGMAPVAEELQRYTGVIAAAPITLTCMGIGVNGHIAFNEPGDTRFDDPRAVREITLEHQSRQQQVDEECFASLAEVPVNALTLTVPVLMSAQSIVMTVLGSSKAKGVAAALRGPIGEVVPATAVRNHPDVAVFLDRGAAAELEL